MRLIGYKAMKYENGMCISGADSRIRFRLFNGHKIIPPGVGLFLSLNEKYVKDFYMGLHDVEALLILEFDTNNIKRGSIDDMETELSVSEATIITYYIKGFNP